MKNAFLFLLLLSFTLTAFAQEKPLSQAEYVKMLYAAEKNPTTRPAIVDALRRRGVAFTVTDGIRGLTRSKGRNDEELKRALEEAERRRQNPEAAKLPTAEEAADALEKLVQKHSKPSRRCRISL